MREQDITKMEFLLTLNDRIIVQRFYNVKGFNPRAKNSLELTEFIKDVKNDLSYDLKMRTVTYMVDNMNQIIEDENVLNTSMTSDAENFNLFIKVGDETICHRQFNAKVYPPKVRYTVDVRPYLKNILKGLTDIFSDENLTYEYMGLPLEV
jgi:hypothetical protein